jgi:biopolymer transport protein ExbD
MLKASHSKPTTMASIDTAALGSKRTRHAIPRIDMTPMVDLGFLLVTFFIFTTSMSENLALKIVIPKDEPNAKPNNLPKSAAITVLLDGNKVYAYRGDWKDAVTNEGVQPTILNYNTGLGLVIRKTQEQLKTSGKKQEDAMLLIKPSPDANYQQVIDALDQALICRMTKYTIVEPDAAELQFLATWK